MGDKIIKIVLISDDNECTGFQNKYQENEKKKSRQNWMVRI